MSMQILQSMTQYSKYLGSLVEDPRIVHDVLPWGENIMKGPEKLYNRARAGIPTGTVSFSENISCIDRLKACFIKGGYNKKIPTDINPELYQHVLYFRANLDAYDELIQNKVFSRDEIYFRCLDEGPSFSKFIKKSRAFSLQAKVCIGDCTADDRYIHQEYSGYDSILHERYLIYWDDTEDVLDYYYSMLETKDGVDYTNLDTGWKRLVAHYDLFGREQKYNDFIDKIANKKSYTFDNCKTVELKNTWQVCEPNEPYFACRKVVPVEPGQTRDTGVPDVYSLNRLKVLHKWVKEICDRLPYSGNTNFQKLNIRLQRLREKSVFIHIDFKKFGLLFPRGPLNRILELSNREDLKLNEMYLRVDDDIIKTNRGGILGWFDSAVSLSTISILYSLAEREGWGDFDMLQFNDDIEIGFDIENEAEIQLRQWKICRELESFDYVLSWKKIYSSTLSVFLEDYVEKDYTDLDYAKIQLAVKPFAKALCCKTRAEAKTNFAHGANFGYTTRLKDEIMSSFPPLYPEEYGESVEIGGWMPKGFGRLNTALENASEQDIKFFLAIKKYREPHLAKETKLVCADTILKRRVHAIYQSINNIDMGKAKIELDDPIVKSPDEVDALELEVEVPEQEVPKLPPRLPARPAPRIPDDHG